MAARSLARAALLGALGATLLPGAVRALDLNLSGVNTLRYGEGKAFDELVGLDRDRLFLEETLDLDLTGGGFRLNLASQATRPAEFPDSPPRIGDDRIEDFQLIRRSLEWTGPLTVTLGDFWTTFGNGLALSLYRDETLVNPRLIGNTRSELPASWDNGGDGGLVEWSRGPLAMKALWGNTDYVGKLAGGNAEWNLPFGSLGGSLVRATAVPQNDDIRLGALPTLDLYNRELYGVWRVAGAELSLNHVDQHQLDNEARNAGAGGLATYASASGQWRGWTALAEYKYYRFARRSLYFNSPPTAQREIPTKLIARSTHRVFSNEDECGLQVDLSRGLGDGQTLRASGAWASHIGDGWLPEMDEAHNAYQEYTAGWQKEFSPESHLDLSAAYTEESNGWRPDGQDPVVGAEWFRRTGVGAALLVPVPVLRSVELAGEYLVKTERRSGEESTGMLFWTELFPSSVWSLNLTADYEEDSNTRQDWMGSAELRADLSFPKSVHHTLTVFAGSLRGGQVCSNGNCRIVAPFEGVKVGLVSQF